MALLPGTIWGFISFMTVTMLLIFIVLMLLLTPAMTFLRGRLGGKIMLFAIRPDKSVDITLANYDGGTLSSKYGYFIPVVDSMYNIKKGGPGAFVFSSYGIALNPDIVKGLEYLAKEGYIKNRYELEMAEKYYRKCNATIETKDGQQMKCDFQGIPVIQQIIDEDTKEVTGIEYFCPMCRSQNLEEVEVPFKVNKSETIKFQAIQGFLPYINPHYMESSAEKKVAKILRRQRDPIIGAFKWLAFMVIGALGIGMVYYFVKTFIGGA